MSSVATSALTYQKGFALLRTRGGDQLIDMITGLPELNMPSASVYFTNAEMLVFLPSLPNRAMTRTGERRAS